jgi:pimeloyl-ACP methyl ester carboxylesterase
MALYVRESGPVDAPTIVMLPGGGTGGWFWEPQIERLGDYHLLVPDLPEQGQSMAEKPFTLPDAARRVADLIHERARGGHAHCVGLSLGAQTLLQLLATEPALLDSALVSGANVRGLPGSSLLRPYFRMFMPFRAVPWLLRWSMQSGGIPQRFYPDVLAEAQATTLDAITHVTLESVSFRLPPGLAQVQARVLITVGQREYGLIKNSARDLTQAIPCAQGRMVPKGIHAWNMQYPDLFVRTLRAWMEFRSLPAELLLL